MPLTNVICKQTITTNYYVLELSKKNSYSFRKASVLQVLVCIFFQIILCTAKRQCIMKTKSVDLNHRGKKTQWSTNAVLKLVQILSTNTRCRADRHWSLLYPRILPGSLAKDLFTSPPSNGFPHLVNSFLCTFKSTKTRQSNTRLKTD